MKNACKIKQRDLTDCGAACLASVAAYYKRFVPIAKIRQLSGTGANGTTVYGMVSAAEALGFHAKAVKISTNQLDQLPLPVIAHVKQKDNLHFIVIYKVKGKWIQVMDPLDGISHTCSIDDFFNQTTGIFILMIPAEEQVTYEKPASNLTRFIGLIRPQAGFFIQIIIAALFYTLLGVAPSIYLQKLIDHVLMDRNLRLLNLLSMFMLVFLLMQSTFGYIKSFLVLKTGQFTDAKLILGYYKHLMRLPQHFFDTMRVGEIMSRVNDAVKIRMFINSTAVEFLINIFIIVFSFFVMMIYSIKLSCLVLAFFPLFIVIYLLSIVANKKAQRKIMESAADLEAQLVESLNAAGTIKQLALERFVNNKTTGKFLVLLRAVFNANNFNIYSLSFSDFLSKLLTLTLLWVGSYFVIRNELTTGELLSFYALIGYFTLPVISLINATRNIQEAFVAASRLFEIIDLETEPSDDGKMDLMQEHLGDIIFKNVDFFYNPGYVIYQQFSTSFEKGKMTALVGESGSGKSTLLSLLQCLYPLKNGSISIGIYDIKHIKTSSLRRIISIVPQQIDLFAVNIIENIAIGEAVPDLNRIFMLCRMLSLDEFIEKWPDNYRTVLHKTGTNLSGGQKQRLAIARALYRDPEILILDEATSSLDRYSEIKVQEALLWFRGQGKTIIVIAHRLSTIRYCDEIKVLKGGRIEEEGSHDELLLEKGIYWEMWNAHRSC